MGLKHKITKYLKNVIGSMCDLFHVLSRHVSGGIKPPTDIRTGDLPNTMQNW